MDPADLRGADSFLRHDKRRLRSVFLPVPSLSLSQWAETYRVISEGRSPFPGRWHNSLTPYLVEIMDACSDPSIEMVVIKKSAQIGYTDGILNNLVGYYIDQQPSPILMLQPTIEAANAWSKEKLTPMLRDTPQLRGRVKESGRRDAENTLRLKVFAGGYLAIVGANSAVGLRSRAIRVVLADEIDAFRPDAKGGQNLEGDPLALAITRTQNFANRKIISGSTPTIKGFSRVDRDYDLSDQRLFFVPCPHCGYAQVLRWKNFRWENSDPATTVYLCGEISEHGELTAGCGKPITEEDKASMIAAGRWIPQRPGRPTRGYFIWAAYSLFVPWPKIVDRWLRAQHTPQELQAFVNQVLGECWEDKGEQVEFGTLEARRENYTAEVPLGVGLLTAGVDVQGDRLEVSVWGWGKGDESWLIRHETFWGNPVEEAPWRQLDLFRMKVWQHAGGREIRLAGMAVDSGGHHTDQVYRYGKSRKGVFVVKGSSESGAAPVGRPSRNNRASVALFPIGTVALKDSLYGRLKITALGPGFVHFPQVDEEYLRQLTAEAVRTHFEKGRIAVRRYEKVYARNEALDCAVYARAALLILGPLDQLGVLVDRLQPRGPTPAAETPKGVQVPKKPPRRGGWINRW